MWNRRKDETPAPAKPASAPPTPSELAKEGIPMSTLPSRPAESGFDAARGGTAVLGKSVIVKGQIFGREDLTIDGEVEGTVELQEHRLTVGPNGKVTASVKAREVVALGTIHGNVEARDKVEIRKDAKLVGDIRTARIVIDDGAYFKGNIDIVRAEAPRAASAPKPAVPVAPTGTSPGTNVGNSPGNSGPAK
jgi:cytoskeletal protein CcmA (bactofilin family)